MVSYRKYSDLSFCSEIISFGPYVKLRSECLAVWISQNGQEEHNMMSQLVKLTRGTLRAVRSKF